MEENRERDEISLANYFAVDILENIFNNIALAFEDANYAGSLETARSV